jgi:AcrR family transcriptional regulator
MCSPLKNFNLSAVGSASLGRVLGINERPFKRYFEQTFILKTAVGSKMGYFQCYCAAIAHDERPTLWEVRGGNKNKRIRFLSFPDRHGETSYALNEQSFKVNQRGKEMKYDRQDVIEKATHLFWEKGYHGTSMRNLQEVTDLRPGSIYAGFGCKDGLYKETLRFYAGQGKLQLQACVESTSTPLEALKLFMRNAVLGSPSAPNSMCMLVKSISELTENDNPELLDESKQLLRGIEGAFVELLTQAVECGELDPSKEPRRLARFLQMQLMGVRAYAQANRGNVSVEELLEDVFSCLH